MPHRSTAPTLAAVLAVITLTACSKSSTDTAPAAATPPAATAPTAATTPATPMTYTINISPEWKVGAKFGYVADDVTNSPDGKVAIHFEADGEVLALMPSGNPQKVTYTVKTLTVTRPGKPATGLPAKGEKIGIEYGMKNKELVTFNDQPTDADTADLLASVLWLTAPDHSDQEMFGPPTPVAVAATWPLNSAAFMDYHVDGGMHFTSASGSLLFEKVDGDGDSRVSVISGNFKCTGQGSPDDLAGFSMLLKFTATTPLNHHGAYKETLLTTTTAPGGPGESSTIVQETTTEEVTMK